MNLQEHMDMLGMEDADHLAFRAKVPKAAVRRALQGKPIAESIAHRICETITSQYSNHANTQHAAKLTPEDIGLVTFTP